MKYHDRVKMKFFDELLLAIKSKGCETTNFLNDFNILSDS